MRVICDDCPCVFDGDYGMHCGLDDSKIDFIKGKYVSDSCRLIKIVTQDGEIYPEPEETANG